MTSIGGGQKLAGGAAKKIKDSIQTAGGGVFNGFKKVSDKISSSPSVSDGISNIYDYVTGTGRYNNDFIFVNPDALRDEASRMRSYQQEYTNVMQKITNLIITLKQNNIWDAPATTTFIDNYIELKDVFDKFGRVMTEYSSIMEGVSERMRATDNTMSGKFENLSL